MQSKINQKSNGRYWLEKILYNLGVMCVGIWLWSFANSTIMPDWEDWSFDQHQQGANPTVTGYVYRRSLEFAADLAVACHLAPPRPAADRSVEADKRPSVVVPPILLPVNTVVGRLEIPRLGVRVVVREGDGEQTLVSSLGHIPGTALPGEKGNIGVAGHRDTFFRPLRGIANHDILHLETSSGSYTYEVVKTQIVKPKDVGVLRSGTEPEMTLVTCFPFSYIGDAPDRFIVTARLVSGTPGESAQKTSDHQQPVAASLASVPASEPARPSRAPVLKDPPTDTRSAEERRVSTFAVAQGRTKQLAPGILFGVSDFDSQRSRFSAWVFVKSTGRTSWWREHRTGQPIVFRNEASGERYQLTISDVVDGIAVGSLLMPSGRDVASTRVASKWRHLFR